MSKSTPWQRTTLALACATAMGWWGTPAWALSLGKLSVRSAIGEPLRAEVDILDINDEEASSLKAAVAPPDAFKASGLDYSSTLNGTEITLQRRANGQPYLQLRNSRPVNDPYVDLVLQASWSSGRIVRDYTMLFDPPALGNSSQVALPSQVPQVSSVPVRIAPAADASAALAPAPAATPAPAPAATPVAAAPAPAAAPVRTPAPAAAPAPTPKNVPTPAPAMRANSVTVKAGDTATRIASSNKTADVSLDQMLVAMLRANPDAFVSGNVNRLRKGVVLSLPGASDALSTSQPEAHQIIVAQSRDFNEYRRRLAEGAPEQKDAADRKSAGGVQAQVEARKPAAATPDKLTLSKGGVQSKGADRLAQDRNAQDAKKREEELKRNVDELAKLNSAAQPAPTTKATAGASPAPAVSTPAPAPVAGPAIVTKPSVADAGNAPKPAASAPTTAMASAPAASAPRPAPKVAPAPQPMAEEPSILDDLLDNPLALAGGGGVLALLAGLAFYRVRQRRTAAQVDSAYLESRLQPDSFFGNSGGQRVDTNDSNVGSSSSMVYSPSQLDAGDDVDPVAEADVYLAYGRDLQAEEILKEALRNHPTRVAIHQKLLEIYAKRRDAKSFGAVAKEAYKVTNGQGPEWDAITELGRDLDAGNNLYQPGGTPAPSAPAPLAPAPEPAAASYSATQAVSPMAPAPAAGNVDLDLDLDFSLDEPGSGPAPVAAAPMGAPVAAPPSSFAAATPTAAIQLRPEPAVAMAPPADNGLNFDMGGLSLDLGSPASEQPTGTEDPLATKLALADEFKAIGDTDGARALIEEILSEATGDMKTRAEQALAALG